MKAETINIEIANWTHDQNDLKQIRTEVFITEQHVPKDLEWDDDDKYCTHFLARKNGNAIATARLKTNGHIGRMAVLKPERGRSVGSKLLQFVLSYAKSQDLKSVYLNAQIDVIKFYEQYGFTPYGEEFLDAGIAHRAMKKDLT